MAMLKVIDCFARLFLVPTPFKATGSAGIFAFGERTLKGTPMYMHAFRHTNVPTIEKIEKAVLKAKEIDLDKWVEIDSDAYIKRNSIVVKATGQVVRFGDRPRRNMAASDSQDMDTHGEQADIYRLPTADECPRHPSGKGYAL